MAERPKGDDMKKLEPGCKAMIVKSINHPNCIGTILNVKGYAGVFDFKVKGGGIVTAPGWQTDFSPNIMIKEGYIWGEECLMRIDDQANISGLHEKKPEIVEK